MPSCVRLSVLVHHQESVLNHCAMKPAVLKVSKRWWHALTTGSSYSDQGGVGWELTREMKIPEWSFIKGLDLTHGGQDHIQEFIPA